MNLLDKLFGRKPNREFRWMEPAELATALGGDQPPLVIDVRGPDEFSGPLGHIETALNVPLQEVQQHFPGWISQPRQLVFVCHTDRRSATAAQQVIARHPAASVAVLRGGMVAWRSREET